MDKRDDPPLQERTSTKNDNELYLVGIMNTTNAATSLCNLPGK